MSEAFDKADWHLEGTWPEGLPDEQAAVHIGFYLAWMIDRQLYSSFFEEIAGDLLEHYRQGRISGAQILFAAGWVLADDMMNDECEAFSHAYYDDYLREFPDTVEAGGSGYEAVDSPDNAKKVCAHLDKRFGEWRSKGGYVPENVTDHDLDSVLQKVAQKSHQSNDDCKSAFESALGIIAEELSAGRRVIIEGLGTIERRELATKEIEARGNVAAIPAIHGYYIGFNAAVPFKKAVDSPPVSVNG